MYGEEGNTLNQKIYYISHLRLLCLVILVVGIMLPLQVQASSINPVITSSDEEYDYEELSDGTIRLVDYLGSDTKPIVPATLDDKTISEIANFTFADKGITELTISSSTVSFDEPDMGYSEMFTICGDITNIIIRGYKGSTAEDYVNQVNETMLQIRASPTNSKIFHEDDFWQFIAIDEENDWWNITYDLDGGTVSYNPDRYDPQSLKLSINNPSKAGYIFLGWTWENSDIPEKDVVIPVGTEGDLHFVAHWKKNDDTGDNDTENPDDPNKGDTANDDSNKGIPQDGGSGGGSDGGGGSGGTGGGSAGNGDKTGGIAGGNTNIGNSGSNSSGGTGAGANQSGSGNTVDDNPIIDMTGDDPASRPTGTKHILDNTPPTSDFVIDNNYIVCLGLFFFGIFLCLCERKEKDEDKDKNNLNSNLSNDK